MQLPASERGDTAVTGGYFSAQAHNPACQQGFLAQQVLQKCSYKAVKTRAKLCPASAWAAVSLGDLCTVVH